MFYLLACVVKINLEKEIITYVFIWNILFSSVFFFFFFLSVYLTCPVIVMQNSFESLYDCTVLLNAVHTCYSRDWYVYK